MTFKFDKMTDSDVGEWQGDEQKAADWMNDVLDILADLASKKFPDPTREQEEAVNDLANRFFFADLCNDPDTLGYSYADKKFYVQTHLADIE
jgi:hypothetical protein